MAGRGFNSVHGFDNGPAPPGMIQGAPNMPFQQPYGVAPGYLTQQFYGYPPPQYVPGYPQGMVPQHPSFRPPEGPVPGIHLRNHTGGVGLPPGYDYTFPLEHTKIHVFTTRQKPWESSAPSFNTQLPHMKLFVPSCMTTKQLMQNLGCNNSEAKNNILIECCEKGNGLWATGLRIKGDDKDRMKKSIDSWGWDKSRTGHPGEKGVVWLWVSNKGD